MKKRTTYKVGMRIISYNKLSHTNDANIFLPFLVGLFFPFGNARGTAAGVFVALILVHFLSVGYLINGPNQDPLPLIPKWKADTNNQVTCFPDGGKMGVRYTQY